MNRQHEAARWFVELQDSPANSEKFLEWQQWLNAAQENRAAYEDIEDAVLRMGRLNRPPKLPTAEEMLQDNYDGSMSIKDWKTWKNRNVWPRLAVAAGITAFAVTGAWFWMQHLRDPGLGSFSYQTRYTERREVVLPEGSKITLDADSALDVRYSSGQRLLTLKRGEAYFEVAKDAGRPFVVHAGGARITALGTAFNVRMSADRTVVAVTEGKVEFIAQREAARGDTRQPHMTAQLDAGEAVSYRDSGNLQALPPQETPLATTWLEGRRQYREEPLRYVLADLDRHTGQRIELASDGVGELKFTGTLDLGNSDGWLQGLSVALPVKVTRREDGSLFIEGR